MAVRLSEKMKLLQRVSALEKNLYNCQLLIAALMNAHDSGEGSSHNPRNLELQFIERPTSEVLSRKIKGLAENKSWHNIK
jgi:hypothetical protein